MNTTAIPWYEARDLAQDAVPLLESETVTPSDAIDRTTPADVTARCDLPGYDTSAMDGWAVAGPGPWTVLGSVLAGHAPPDHLALGTAMVIATGAAVPTGASGIVRREVGTVMEQTLHATDPPKGHDIRPRGTECHEGDVLVSGGTALTPAQVGLLAAAGVDEIQVIRVPRVRLLLLGDELLDHGIPGIGQVRDSLGPQLPGWIARLGGSVTTIERVPDTADALTAALANTDDVDLIITTGGTAAGPVDHLHTGLAGVGADLLIDSVAVRPGHPMMLASRAGTPILGLPGNPQSAVVGLVSLGAPMIRAMLGRSEPDLRSVTLTESVTAPPAEHRLLLATIDGATCTPTTHLGSAMLRGLAAADGFVVIPPGGAPADAVVDWLPLP